MPAAVTAAVSAVGAAIGGTSGAFLIMNATAVASAALVATSLSVGNYQRRKAKQAARAAFNAGLEDRLVMVSTATGARSRCYGRVRNVDGVLFKGTRGTNNEFYTLFIAVAGHEIDGFEDVYFGDIKVTLDGNGYVQTAPFAIERRTSQTAGITLSTGSPGGTGTATITGTYVAGSASAVQPATESTDEKELSVSVVGSTITVSGGTPGAAAIVNWQTSSLDSKARVRFYTGSLNQDLSVVLDPLFPSLIDSTHKFAGIAGLLVDLEYDPDAWPSGVPSISAVFRGACVEDPRASPSLVWTENPALIARDWALYKYGGGAALEDIDEQSFEDAANACDVTHGFVTPSGTTTLPLYTCGIVCRTDVDPYDQFLEIVESMAGKAGWAGGQLRVVAGEYRSPVATITEDWISDAGEIQIVAEPPTEDAVNVYRGTISDKDQDYVVVQAPEVRSSTYITADGRELPREVALAGVTDAIHAQHVMGVMMRDARNGLTCVLPCNMRAFQVELFDVVSVTLPRFGWTAKTFEVIDWSFSPEGGVVLTLKETAAAIFTPDSLFRELDLTPNTDLPEPWVVETPFGLVVTTAVSTLDDGQPVVRALVQWSAITDSSILQGGAIEIQYLQLGAVDSLVGWVNDTPVTVTWQNSAGQAVAWNSQQPVDPSNAAGWQTVRVAGNQTSHIIPALKAGASYLFRIRGVNPIGVASKWSLQRLVVTDGVPLQASQETWFAFDATGVLFSNAV